MRPDDYYGHYKAFVKELSNNSGLTLQQYCSGHGIMWRRLYDWMRRRHISLKRLYATYKEKEDKILISANRETAPHFREILPERSAAHATSTNNPTNNMDSGIISLSRILLPTGTVIEMKDCPVSSLSVLLSQCMGEEVPDV